MGINLTKSNKLYCPICSKTYRAQDPKEFNPYVSIPNWGCETYTWSKKPVWLVEKMGKYGRFAGCPNFPKCKTAISLEPKSINIDYEDELRPY